MVKKDAAKPTAKSTAPDIDVTKIPIKDISHPDETAPDASSRPIIVTNRPIMRDTMVNKEGTESEEPKKPKLSRNAGEAVIQPLEETLPAAEDAEAEKQEPQAETEESPAIPAAPAEDKPNEEEKPATEEKPDETKKADTKEAEPAKKALSGQEAEAAEAAEAAKQAKHDAAIQKLVDSKKYELPINAVEKRRSKRVALLGVVLSVLLLLTWADVALDAGILHINGIKPVTHFFSN